ncbi:MAG TPA: signal peptidase I [Candidatus Treponema faecavium]|nr:signal peptidase I [Candidatus Treponema faecavium]
MESNLYKNSYAERLALQRKILRVSGIILAVFVIVTAFLRFIVFPVSTNSISMLPSLAERSSLLVTPLVRGEDSIALGRISRGDMVLLDSLSSDKKTPTARLGDAFVSFFTFQKLFPFTSSSLMTEKPCVRRVVGMPGDTLYMRDFVMYIRPEGQTHFLTEFEVISKEYDVYLDELPDGWDTNIGVCSDMAEFTLQSGEYFVLSDNRTSSADSRIWGTVDSGSIRGKAFFCYFPFSCFGIK